MKRSVFLFVITLLLTACETKQWNLNQTIGWESDSPDNYAVLFVKLNQVSANERSISDKRKFDEAVVKSLRANKLGDQAENDEEGETDFHFVVSKDYEKAMQAILSVARTYGIEKQVTIYKRDYQSYDSWTDKAVHPK